MKHLVNHYHGNQRSSLLCNLLLNLLLCHISCGDTDHLVLRTKVSFSGWLAVFLKNSLKVETPLPVFLFTDLSVFQRGSPVSKMNKKNNQDAYC